MVKQGAESIIGKIAKIYFNLVKRIGSLLAFLCAAVGIAALLVLPVWYLADNFRKLYTIIVLAGIGGAVIFFSVRKGLRKSSSHELPRGQRFIRFLWRFGAVLLFIGWIYFILIMILRGMIVPALLLILSFIAAFGFFLYAKQKTDRKT